MKLPLLLFVVDLCFKLMRNVLLTISCLSRNLKACAQQTSYQINLFDKQHENETFYYDLAYLSSNFTNLEALQNKFSSRERSGSSSSKHSCNFIRSIPSNLRGDLKLSYFYQKYTETYGIPVIGSNKVNHNSFRRACYVLRFLLASSTEIREQFYKKFARVVLLGTGENILHVPEYSKLPSSWSFLTRGLSATSQIPLITVGEENVQCSNDKFKNEDLLVHLIANSLLSLNALNDDAKNELDLAFRAAKSNDFWLENRPFSLADRKEYLSTGIAVYLNSYARKDSLNQISLDELVSKDPGLNALMRKILPCENAFLNKCKSNREAEYAQLLKQGKDCLNEGTEAFSNNLPFTLSSTRQLPSKKTAETIPARYSTSAKKTTKTSTSSSSNRPIIILTPASQAVAKSTTKKFAFDNNFAINDSFFNRVFKDLHSSSTISRAQTESTLNPILTTILTSNEKQELCENLNENCDRWAARGQCIRNKQYMQIECRKSCNLCFRNESLKTIPTPRAQTTPKFDLSFFANLCKDDVPNCYIMALNGECKTNPHYMLEKCKRSCNLCGSLVDKKDRISPASTKRSLTSYSFNSRTKTVSFDEHDSSFKNESAFLQFLFNAERDLNRLENENQEQEAIGASPAPKSTTAASSASKSRTTLNARKECNDLVDYCAQLADRGDCITNQDTMRYYCPNACNFCQDS